MNRRLVSLLLTWLAAAFALSTAACSEHVVAPYRAPLTQPAPSGSAPAPPPGTPAVPFSGTSTGTPPMPRPGPGTTGGPPVTATCAPIATQPAPIQWVPPNPLRHPVCTAQEASVVASCFMLGGQYCNSLGAVNQACVSCAVVPGNSPTYGALVQMDPSQPADLNIPGCVSALTGNITPQGCGPRLMAENACEVAACSHCSETEFVACVQSAASTTCAAQAQAATCADAPLATCLQGNSPVEQATNLIALFCM